MKKTILTILVIITTIIGISINNLTYAVNSTSGTSHTAGEVISEADSFISKGESDTNTVISKDKLKGLSDTIYNILLVLGIIAAVIIGAILGIRFITAGVEGKAEVKQSLIAYVVGCAIVFGAFTIWKIVVTILQGLE